MVLIQETKWESSDVSRARKLCGRGNCGYHFVGFIGRYGGIISLWDKEELEVGM